MRTRKNGLKLLVIFFGSLLISGMAQGQTKTMYYTDSWGEQGLSVVKSQTNNIQLNYSIQRYIVEDKKVGSGEMQGLRLPGVFLPNDAGMPDLPGEGKVFAVPNGATPRLKVVNYRVELIKDFDLAPAPIIPLDTEKDPLALEKNKEVYSTNAFYPAEPFKLSEVSTLRGVNVVTLGITPYQYNPVTRELKVYHDVQLEIEMVGGSGTFGESRLMSKHWGSIMQSTLVNYDAILENGFGKAMQRSASSDAESGFEYVIITIDNPEFIEWANKLAEFRRKQGISTGVVTLTEIGGNTVSQIETWIDNAYNTWTTPPVAVLLLGDYGTGSNGIISHKYDHPGNFPDFASDNRYADVNGDDLPDIVFARITANNAEQLEVMITKGMEYESNPPTDASFYNKPITALGWQTERWFQICSEVVGGYFKNVKGKSPVRINEIYSGTPGDTWSTASKTSTVVDYFGPNGLGYIPAKPSTLGNWSGGNATDIANAINAGSFLLQHRDHGLYDGWGEPRFRRSDINSLNNKDNKLPFIFSINCQTGAFHNTEESFAEKFHRYTHNGENSGALGLIAATEVSYSFVNDAFVWGMFDNMFPDFMPDYSGSFPVNFARPAFANASGKHFLNYSSWPYNTGSKTITHRLFHHHGDAFLTLYTEVPENLTVTAASTHDAGNLTYNVTVEDGSNVALTYFNTATQKTEILGTAISGSGSTTINMVSCPPSGTEMLLTITKQNYYRYTKTVTVDGEAVPVTGVSVEPTTASVKVGEDVSLTKTVSPANAANKSVTWTTSNNSVATVSNAGVVSGVANGTCDITVTTNEGGFTAVCAVTVTEPEDDGGLLTEGVIANGTLDAADGMDMWFIDVPANTAKMRVVLECSGSDFDTYGRFNQEPGTSSGTYDWRGYTSGGEDNTINNPAEGRHYIMADYYSGSGAYTIKVTFEGRQSDDGGLLTPGVAADGNLNSNDGSDMWYIDVPAGTAQMVVEMECGSSDFDTYGKYNLEPGTAGGTYDWRGYTSGGENNTVDSPEAGRHYIMVDYYSGSGDYSLKATLSSAGDINSENMDLGISASNDIVKDAGIRVFPNPVNNYLTIEVSEGRILNASVFDVSGKLILGVDSDSKTKVLDLTEVGSGVYTLKIETEKGVDIQKLIKR